MNRLIQKNNGDEHNFWMSYTDLMSAFLIVFIILSAILYNYYNSEVEEANNEKLSAEVQKERYENLIDSIRTELDKTHNRAEEQAKLIEEMEAKDLKNLIQQFDDVFSYDEEVAYRIDIAKGSIILTHRNPKSDLFAQSDEVIMRPALAKYLRKIGKSLVAKAMEINSIRGDKGIEVRIEGHTDPTWDYQRGTDYGYIKNLQLSSGRANSVYSFILDNCGLTLEQKLFAKKNMISIGYSYSDRLICGNILDKNEDAQSRRIEFRIISK